MLTQTFGQRLEGISYQMRVGAYGIIFDDTREKLAVVKTPKGLFLPGGGLEGYESHHECIKRECIEEIGLTVEVTSFLCQGEHYFNSDDLNTFWHMVAYLYLAKTTSGTRLACETDHQLVWVLARTCPERLLVKQQAWAVTQALGINQLW